MLCFIIPQQLWCFFQKIFATFAVSSVFGKTSHIFIAKGIDLFQGDLFRRQLQLFQQQFPADCRQSGAVWSIFCRLLYWSFRPPDIAVFLLYRKLGVC